MTSDVSSGVLNPTIPYILVLTVYLTFVHIFSDVIILLAYVMQAAQRGVPVYGEPSWGGSRVPAASIVVISHATDAANYTHAIVGQCRVPAAWDNNWSFLSVWSNSMSQRTAEGFSFFILLLASRYSIFMSCGYLIFMGSRWTVVKNLIAKIHQTYARSGWILISDYCWSKKAATC